MEPMKASLRVLLIDDDAKLADLLKAYLERSGIELVAAQDPEKGLKLVHAERPSLVILDVMMPGRDGFSVCKEIRATSDVPVLMLTARGETIDRVVGLELGADDYMGKPFEPRELVARIQSIVRRYEHRPKRKSLFFGELEIREGEQEAFLSGVPLELSTTEFELLNLLASRPGTKFDRDEIMNHLRGFDADVYSRSIDVMVSRLRAKLREDAKSPRFIKTVFGAGYVFLAQDRKKD